KDCRKISERERNAMRLEYHREYLAKNPEKRRLYNQRDAMRHKERRNSQPKSCRIYIRTCIITGKLFVSRSPTVKYSKSGFILHQNEIKQHLGDYRWPKGERICVECGSVFISTPKAKYCSKECAKNYNRYNQKAKERIRNGGRFIEPISRLRVFEAAK